jgi:tetratricopeptide (TPR) repeat protein
MTDKQLPATPPAAPDLIEQNLERLLEKAYRPESPDPAFVQRVRDRLAAVAHERVPVVPHRWPLLGRRACGILAAAAALAGLAFLLQTSAPHRQDVHLQVQGHPRPEERPAPGPDVPPGPESLGAPQVHEEPPPDRLTPRPRPDAPAVAQLAVGQSLRTAAGERRRVGLPDGSIVYLNQKTEVKLDAERRLTLAAGEVFVEVAPRPASERFVVKTPQREVVALGTKFDVSAVAAGTGVTVTQGQVRVSGLDGVLTAGQQLGPDAQKPTSAPRAAAALAWTRELMCAAEAPLVPPSKYAGGAVVVSDPSGQQTNLSLRKYHVDVHVEDGFARTTIDQTYFNHTMSRLEGTFHFPLPPDASLSRLAMYVNGKLMEGGMAERDFARQTFDNIVRRMQDPALLEWVDGSTFKMRVFPLEARQEKRIILSYTQRLSVQYGRASYRFPAGHSLETVRDWSFHARVKSGKALTWASDTHPEILQVSTEKNDLLLDARQRNVKVEGDVAFDLFDGGKQLRGDESARFSTADHDGARYFMVRYRPELPVAAERRHRDWVFLFESSGDRDPLLARTQIEVVRTLLANAEHDDTFAIVTAATRPGTFAPEARPTSPENVAAAVQFLEGTHLVGVLDLDKALAAAGPFLKAARNPYLVHVGSGHGVLGETRAEALIKRIPDGVPYVGVGVGKRWNRALMKQAAERSGGFFTQINPDEPISWRAFELYSALTAPRLLNVRVVDDSEKTMFLSQGGTVAQGEEVCAVTQLAAGAKLPASVTITGTLEGKTFSRSVAVKNVAAGAGYLPRTWAKLQIERLLAENAQGNKARIVQLSLASYVMTPFTSLLVLENDQMYQQYGVDRGRKDHWAMYACPETMPVPQPEPLDGQTPLKAASVVKPSVEDVLGTILVRVPPRVFGAATGADLRAVTARDLYTGALGLPLTVMGAVTTMALDFGFPGAGADANAPFEAFAKPGNRNESAQMDDKGKGAPRPTGAPGPVASSGGGPGMPPPTMGPGQQSGPGISGSFGGQFGGGGFGGQFGGFRGGAGMMPPGGGPGFNLNGGLAGMGGLGGLGGMPGGGFGSGNFGGVPGGGFGSGGLSGWSGGGRGPNGWYYAPMSGGGSAPAPPTNITSSPYVNLNGSYAPLTGVQPYYLQYAPMFVSPTMQWALPNSSAYPFLYGLGSPAKSHGYLGAPIGDLMASDDQTAAKETKRRAPELELLRSFDKELRLYETLDPRLMTKDRIPGELTQLLRLKEMLDEEENGERKKSIKRMDEEGLLLLAQRLSKLRVQQAGVVATPAVASLLGRLRPDALLYRPPTFAPDGRLFTDLVAFAPGLNTSQADVLGVLEVEAAPDPADVSGTVEPAARALIEGARAAGWRTLTVPAAGAMPEWSVSFDGSGRYAAERVLPSGLKEHIICDGKELLHLYPELGLGSRRTLTRFHRAELSDLVPWALPPAKDLAHGFDLKSASERTVVLSPCGLKAEQAALVMHLVFGDDGRLDERRLVELPKNKVLRRETYGADGTVRVLDADNKELSTRKLALKAGGLPDLDNETKDLVMLPMPLRTRDHVLQQPGAAGGNLAAMDDASSLALIAADGAVGNPALMGGAIWSRAWNRGAWGSGFTTLLLSAGQDVNGVPALPNVNRGPLAHYVAWLKQTEPLSETKDRDLGDGLLRRLAEVQSVVRAWRKDGAPLTDKDVARAIQAIREAKSPLFAWAVVAEMLRLPDNKRVTAAGGRAKLKREVLEAACVALKDAPGLSYAARYELARHLADNGERAEARKRFQELYEETAKTGALPPVDRTFRQTLQASDREPDLFGELLRSRAAGLVKDGRRVAAVTLAWQCWELEAPALADELLAAALDGIPDREHRTAPTLIAVEYLAQSHRYDRANKLLQELLTDETWAKSPGLWRMGYQLALQRKQPTRAFSCLAEALELDYRQMSAWIDLAAVRRDYGALLGHYAEVVRATATLGQKPPDDLAAKVVRAADRWRWLDVDGATASSLASQSLRGLGRPDLAWDYLLMSAGVDQPGYAWVNLAQSLEQQEDYDLAERAYEQACVAAPGNADLMRMRADNLLRAGHAVEGREVLRRIGNMPVPPPAAPPSAPAQERDR